MKRQCMAEIYKKKRCSNNSLTKYVTENLQVLIFEHRPIAWLFILNSSAETEDYLFHLSYTCIYWSQNAEQFSEHETLLISRFGDTG